MIQFRANTIAYYPNVMYEDKKKAKLLKETKEKMEYRDEFIQSKIKDIDIKDLVETNNQTSTQPQTKEEIFKQKSINKYKEQVYIGRMIELTRY